MDAKTKAMLDLLASQRNQALDAFVGCAGELAVVTERVSELEAKVAALEPKEGPVG